MQKLHGRRYHLFCSSIRKHHLFIFIFSFSVFLHLPFSIVHSCTFVVNDWLGLSLLCQFYSPATALIASRDSMIVMFILQKPTWIGVKSKDTKCTKNCAFNDELSLWGKQLNDVVFIWYHIWRNVQQMLLLWNITSFIYWELHVEIIPNKHLQLNCCWLELWSWTPSAIATR